jgi:NAD-dependent dihydropyrimidine dehydrogenase PreA subunit
MKRTRQISQILFFFLFIYTFFLTTYPLKSVIPLNLFFLLSPLSAIVAIISSPARLSIFLPALSIIATTFLLGRYFCGWLCPLGFSLDVMNPLFFRRLKTSPRLTHLKYYILIFVLTGSFLALSPVFFFEPLTIIFRTFTLAFFPTLFALWRSLAAFFPFLLKYPPAPSSSVIFRGGLLFLVFFLVIVALDSVARRFWCRNLCPLGALLALTSRFSFHQKVVSERCIDCGLCRQRCRTGAIYPGNRDFQRSECIYCFDCEALCPTKAISFAFRKPQERVFSLKKWLLGRSEVKSPDMRTAISRRGFLLSSAGGVLWVAAGRMTCSGEQAFKRLIRPPGSLPERHFVSLCTRCGECMKVCITNGLQPSMLETGLSGLWTPRLIPLKGYCEENCNLCTLICPTGAIRPVEVKDKKKIQIGLAYIDEKKCIAYIHGSKCLVCNEHCSYGAVFFKESKGVLQPYVDKDKCVGCGICENKCPTGPDPSIVVYARDILLKDYKKKE